MDADLAYFAGLIDGEGSIGTFGGVFTIEVKMTTKELIYALQERFGGNVMFRPRQKAHYKDQWRWRVKARLARSAYAELRPYLRLKLV